MKNFFKKSLFASLFVFQFAHAAEFVLGGHAGALGTSGKGPLADKSTLAYGANLKINPYDWAALKLDATFGQLDNRGYFSTSPALMLSPILFEEFTMGFLAGPGFYKLPTQSTKFGLNFGVAGDFNLADSLSVGMEARYHPIFDSDDIWTVFVTLGFRFKAGDDW